LKQPLQLHPGQQHEAHQPATATLGPVLAVAAAPLDAGPAAEATSIAGGNSTAQPLSTASNNSSSNSLQDRLNMTQQGVTSSGPASNTDSLYGFQIVGLPAQPTDEPTAAAAAAAATNNESTSKELLMPQQQEQLQQQDQEQEGHQQQLPPGGPPLQQQQQLPDTSSMGDLGGMAAEPGKLPAVLNSAVDQAAGFVQVVPASEPAVDDHQAPEQPSAVQLPPTATAASGVLPAAAAAVAAAVSAAAAPVAALGAVTYAAEDAVSGQSPTKGSASSKEAQLTKLVDTLRKRLDTVRAENQQLEDLLHSAEHRTAAEVQRTQQLEAELAAMQRDQDGMVASVAANAAAQDAKIGRLQQELEAANRQVAALQDALESIQEQHQQMLSSKDTIEGGALEGEEILTTFVMGQSHEPAVHLDILAASMATCRAGSGSCGEWWRGAQCHLA
jgi:hypothetical protein